MTRSHSGSRRCLPDLSPPRAASFPCSRQTLVKAADPRMETRCRKIISREDQGSSAQASGARSSSDVDSAPGTSHSSKWAGERNQRSPQNGTSAPRRPEAALRGRRRLLSVPDDRGRGPGARGLVPSLPVPGFPLVKTVRARRTGLFCSHSCHICLMALCTRVLISSSEASVCGPSSSSGLEIHEDLLPAPPPQKKPKEKDSKRASRTN